MNKLLVIFGPTATGKTDLGIRLAKKFGGEIISADSRQIYRGMDIGTGKDINRNSKFINQSSKIHIKNQKLETGHRRKQGILIWLVDIVNPDYPFNAAMYRDIALPVITYIQKQGKLPILVGGTGFYIQSVLQSPETFSIPPDTKLREELDQLTVGELQKRMMDAEPKRLILMNNSDRNNPRRLVRAIEVAEYQFRTPIQKKEISELDTLVLGLTLDRDKLYQRIDDRVERRVHEGIINEISHLLNVGYRFDLPSWSACGYRIWKEYFEEPDKEKKKNLFEQTVRLWKYEEHAYARRQMTWFNKLKGINSFNRDLPETEDQIDKTVAKWYNSDRSDN